MTAKYLWLGIQGIEQTNGATIVAIDNGIGLIIPDSGFASTTAKYEFLAALSQKIASANSEVENAIQDPTTVADHSGSTSLG